MQKPTDFSICSHCFLVSMSGSNLQTGCDCFSEEDLIPATYISWAKYLFLEPSLPSIPVDGKKYPLPKKLYVSRNHVMDAIAACDDDFDHYHLKNHKLKSA